MTRFIETIIEPTKLLLAWQSMSEACRTRHIVGELVRVGDNIDLNYLPNTTDFEKARQKGFDSYPAFPEINKTHHNVLDAFMRRLPPKTRGDYSQYLASLRIKPDSQLSPFSLLGYSGARLPSDGFSIIHPFSNVNEACELLIEAAGYRHIYKNNKANIAVGDAVSFVREFNEVTQEEAIRMMVGDKPLGYVNRGLIPTMLDWLNAKRIVGAWIEKLNGTPEKPAVYIYVQVAANK